MDTSPLPGFITRKEASKRCHRSERTLQRYWSRAMELQDTKVLQHLRLSTEDGVKHEGVNVTKELIDELKKQRQNPTWYVEAAWAEKTYQPKAQDAASDGQHNKEAAKVKTASQSSEEGSARTFGADYVALLERQIEDLKNDKAAMREQIAQSTDTLRQNNKLQQELHILLKQMQDRLLLPPADSGLKSTRSPAIIETQQLHSPEGVNEDPTAAKPQRSQSSGSRKKRGGKKKPAKKGFFSLDTPTLRKLSSSIFRR